MYKKVSLHIGMFSSAELTDSLGDHDYAIPAQAGIVHRLDSTKNGETTIMLDLCYGGGEVLTQYLSQIRP